MPTRWGVFVWGASSRRGLAERSSPQNIDYGLRKTLNRNERTAVSLARDEGTDLDEFPAIAFDEPVKARARFEKWPSVVVGDEGIFGCAATERLLRDGAIPLPSVAQQRICNRYAGGLRGLLNPSRYCWAR
jgi:hypothetical protein